MYLSGPQLAYIGYNRNFKVICSFLRLENFRNESFLSNLSLEPNFQAKNLLEYHAMNLKLHLSKIESPLLISVFSTIF